MEPIHYQPEGDLSSHLITAELTGQDPSGTGLSLTFRIRSDGEEIGEVDVYSTTAETSFITGTSPEERINNGYLRPASLAIAACMHEDHSGAFGNTRLYDLEDNLID